MKSIKNLAFIAIDDLSITEPIKEKIKEVKDLSFDGLVFQPRNYSNNPRYLCDKYMKAVSDIIVFAKSLGMEFWLYDENGGPSGSANGLVLKALPKMSCTYLKNEDGTINRHTYTAINSLDYDCVKTFIEVTHEAYKSKLTKEAFNHLSGFYSSEAGFPDGQGAGSDFSGVPWHDDFENIYTAEYSEDINARLPELFLPESEGGEFKSRYWEMLTGRLHDCFYMQIQKWCSDNGKQYMAHLKGEESPFFQVSYNGSCLQSLKGISVPGVDALGRIPGNKYYPRIASSLSTQFGSGDSMCELLGGAGWGIEPQDLEDNMKWLIECGINTFVFHICQPKLGYQNITDWPASIPTHLPWKNVIPQIFEKLNQFVEQEFKRPRKILAIIPNRAIWENYIPNKLGKMSIHNGSNPPECIASELSEKAIEMCNQLHNMGRRFNITDEVIFEKSAAFGKDGISLGNATYNTILLTPGCSFSKKGMVALERAKANGVRILSNIPTSDTEVIPLDQIQKKLQEIVTIDTNQSDWTVTFPKNNRFFLRPRHEGDSITLDFEVHSNFKPDKMLVLLSDTAENVSINNIIVQPEKNDDYGTYYNIAPNVLPGKNSILVSGCENLFAFLVGRFKVTSKTGYLIFDERQVQTKYDFIIENESVESNTNLTECGYPFSLDYAAAKKIIVVDSTVNKPYIKIECTYSSAMEVFFDNERIGYIYKNNTILELPSITAGEQHVIEVRVYPSAFNAYGPHFYYLGDSPTISPDQFSGTKNFIDRESAPTNTHNNRMKLVLWTIEKEIEIIQKF